MLSWGDPLFEKDDKSHIRITNFRDGLYHAFKKGKDNMDEDDKFLVKTVSKYLSLVFEEYNLKYKVTGGHNYVFVVPSEWEEEIREDLIRPIFISAGLISKEDHKDRLLFLTDLECIFYNSEDSDITKYLSNRGKTTVLCRLSFIEYDIASIKLNSVSTASNLFDDPYPLLFPNVLQSSTTYMAISDIKSSINLFLRGKLFPADTDTDQARIISKIVEKDWIPDEVWCELDEKQINTMRSTYPIDICTAISKKICEKIRKMVPYSFPKEYEILIINDLYSSERRRDFCFNMWMTHVINFIRYSLNIKTSVKINAIVETAEKLDIIHGAFTVTIDTIKNSVLKSKPRIIPTEDTRTSTSVFLNSRPEAIINIDISLESTLLSYSILGDNGLIETIFDNSHFTVDNNCLHSLGTFYEVSSETTLNVVEGFITFAEEHLMDDLNHYHTDEDYMSRIEAILNGKSYIDKEVCSNKREMYIKKTIQRYRDYAKEFITGRNLLVKKELVSIKQRKYIKAFLLIFDNVNMKIGYAVSIEKILLDNLVGTKEDFRELIYRSGLIKKDDSSKKLRVNIQGEGVLHAIQQSLGLEFPLKSYFVVSVPNLEDNEEPEAMIIKDKIIYIPDIYDSLCLNVWNKLMQDSSLIQHCNKHLNVSDGIFYDLFSLRTKKKFTVTLKEYISQNILSETANWKTTDMCVIQLSSFCGCKVGLSSNDIIIISFKPVLQDIISIVSTSLILKELFLYYSEIKYLFNLICFNYNPRLQDILERIIKEETDNFNRDNHIETLCFVLPELPSQLFQPNLKRRPFLYQGFRIGTLHQVSSSSFGFSVEDERGEFILRKEKKSDAEVIAIEREFFSNIDCTVLLNYNVGEVIGGLDDRTLIDNTFQTIGSFEPKPILASSPMTLSIAFQNYSSSFLIQLKRVGGAFVEEEYIGTGELMTLCRF
ncbi:hypothetical protein INT48_001445 [Thamnidium elegans]|uniref:Uncharacterized protein n=1 Tax=Thamnidium elegans TaxID=101142 RepID=A0A8H7SPF3_9FUNG|nr:hypothetical protein INT48_001445 [Thamnidium elegans]